MDHPTAILNDVASSFPASVRARGIDRSWVEYSRRLRDLQPHLGRRLRVLDLGAGAGVVSLALSRMGHQVVAFDSWREYSPEYDNQMGTREAILERFREAAILPVAGFLMTGNPLPFPDQSFDLVTWFDVIEHLYESPRFALSEVRRVLRTDGILVLTTPNFASLRARLRLLFGKTIHFPIDVWFESAPFHGHIREYTAQELRWMLERAGFQTCTLQYTNAPQVGTRLAGNQWLPGYRLNSIHQLIVGAYLLVTSLVPTWRNALALTATRLP